MIHGSQLDLVEVLDDEDENEEEDELLSSEEELLDSEDDEDDGDRFLTFVPFMFCNCFGFSWLSPGSEVILSLPCSCCPDA